GRARLRGDRTGALQSRRERREVLTAGGRDRHPRCSRRRRRAVRGPRPRTGYRSGRRGAHLRAVRAGRSSRSRLARRRTRPGHGFQVETAETATDAKASYDRRQPDLVVLDINLPDGDGFEIVRHIRERSGTPIIVLSARGGENDKVNALDLGADDYMTKPFGI